MSSDRRAEFQKWISGVQARTGLQPISLDRDVASAVASVRDEGCCVTLTAQSPDLFSASAGETITYASSLRRDAPVPLRVVRTFFEQ